MLMLIIKKFRLMMLIIKIVIDDVSLQKFRLMILIINFYINDVNYKNLD